MDRLGLATRHEINARYIELRTHLFEDTVVIQNENTINQCVLPVITEPRHGH